jgi:hypothetical protein
MRLQCTEEFIYRRIEKLHGCMAGKVKGWMTRVRFLPGGEENSEGKAKGTLGKSISRPADALGCVIREDKEEENILCLQNIINSWTYYNCVSHFIVDECVMSSA